MCDPSFREFFYGRFADFARRQLTTTPANAILREIVGDANLRAFGGPDFADVESVLAPLAEADRPRALVCLFIVVVADQNIHAHFPPHYREWHARTLIPKFGWTGFGLHNENPLKLIQVPADRGAVDSTDLLVEIKLGMPCFVDIVGQSLHRFAPAIAPVDFFAALRADPAMRYLPGHPLLDRLRKALGIDFL